MWARKLHSTSLLTPSCQNSASRKACGFDAHVARKLKAGEWYPRAALYVTKSYYSDSDSSDEDAAVDIDALARKLSQEAERLRRTESNKEASTSQPASNLYGPEDPIFGQQVTNFVAPISHLDFMHVWLGLACHLHCHSIDTSW